MEKFRLDKALLLKGLTTSRDRASRLIKEGSVSVNGNIFTKTSQSVSLDDNITLIGDDIKWVSRAGLKLEKGISFFEVCLENKVCIDIGASTGGFTEVLLDGGASKVFAVDVGHSQLHEKIKTSPKVINLEKTNARALNSSHIPLEIDLIVSDVSFISLTLALPEAFKFLKNGGEVLVLIKPQFELSPKEIDKKGVVKLEKDRLRAVEKIKSFLIENGFRVKGITPSPIKGSDGNIEFLIYAKKDIVTLG